MVRTVATSPANTGADLRVCVGELMVPPKRILHFKRIPRSPAKPAPRLRRRSHVSWYFEYIGGIPVQALLSFSLLRFHQITDQGDEPTKDTELVELDGFEVAKRLWIGVREARPPIHNRFALFLGSKRLQTRQGLPRQIFSRVRPPLL